MCGCSMTSGRLPSTTRWWSAQRSPRHWRGAAGAPVTPLRQTLSAAPTVFGAPAADAPSRVYPGQPLRELTLQERDTRFELATGQPVPGASPGGIAENFPLEGARTIYGSTKLAAELLIEEYRAEYAVPARVNRCGVT